MSRELLKEYIKKAVREKLDQMKKIESNKERSVYMIYKFPGLKNAFENLMSPAFARFVSSIEIIAPKPTTFKVTLSNNMDFTLAYVGKKTFIAKIMGKKYNLNKLGETERASQALANMLELNYNTEAIKDEASNNKNMGSELDADAGGSSFGGGGGPADFPGSAPGGDMGSTGGPDDLGGNPGDVSPNPDDDAFPEMGDDGNLEDTPDDEEEFKI